jgi:precorrin-2 dehydrogenase / sirohydrochlorin ferrochelatase
MLNIVGRVCVVVGGGQVATRKVTGLLEARAQVTVIAPGLTAPLENLAAEGRITGRVAAYIPGMLADLRPLLVFAATDDASVNMQVTEEARRLGILVDVVDSPDESDFTGIAAVRRGPITLAVATGGGSPALAAHLKQRLEQTVGEEYEVLAGWMAELRPKVRETIALQTDRQKLWQAILDSRILDELRLGDVTSARNLLDELVREKAR